MIDSADSLYQYLVLFYKLRGFSSSSHRAGPQTSRYLLRKKEKGQKKEREGLIENKKGREDKLSGV